MLLGLDTSVVLRLLLGTPERQRRQALDAIRKARVERHLVVCADLAVAESYFALQTHYGVPEIEARAQLLSMLTSTLVEPEPGSTAIEALRGTGKPGLVDRLLHGRYSALSATTLTFDKALGRMAGVRLLSKQAG